MKSFVFLIFILLDVNLFSQETVNNRNQLYYKIAPVYNFKQSILSITFDDAVRTQFTKAIPLLNARNIPATFYVPTYTLRDSAFRSMVYNAYLAHHEIGSHTVNHFVLSDLDNHSVEYELSQSQKDINSVLGGNKCLSFAYPGGQYNDSVLQIGEKYYLAGRSVWGGYNGIKSFNRYELRTMSFLPPKAGIGLLYNCALYAADYNLWLIELFHGIDSLGWVPVNSIEFRDYLDKIKNLESRMWFATVSSVVKYYDESKNAQIICDECNDSIYKIRLNDNLNDSIYDQPLSLSIKVPDQWACVQVIDAEFVGMVFENNTKFLLLNAVPNNQLITIKPQIITEFATEPEIRFLNVSPNPFKDFIDIAFEVSEPCNVQISLESINGNTLIMEKKYCSEPIIASHINTSAILRGIYLLKIMVRPNNQVLVKKLFKIDE